MILTRIKRREVIKISNWKSKTGQNAKHVINAIFYYREIITYSFRDIFKMYTDLKLRHLKYDIVNQIHRSHDKESECT